MSLRTFSDKENLRIFEKQQIEVERRKKLIDEQIGKLYQDRSILVLAGGQLHNEIYRLKVKLGIVKEQNQLMKTFK